MSTPFISLPGQKIRTCWKKVIVHFPSLWYLHSKLLTCSPDATLRVKGIIYGVIYIKHVSGRNFFSEIIRHYSIVAEHKLV